MNIWQYARWVYLIGRSIKNKSLQNSEKQAFVIFIDQILKTRPMLKTQINFKVSNSLIEWKKQNDYSLGKMLQFIGRNLKVLPLTLEQKKLCDKLFFATDKRRFLSYNEYQALDGNNVFVSENEKLDEIINNCNENSVIVLTDSNYETNLNVSVKGTKITSENNSVIKGDIVVSANDVTFENVSIESETPLIFNSNETMENVNIKNVKLNNDIKINADVEKFTIENVISDKGIEFNGNSQNVLIQNNELNEAISFNSSIGETSIFNNKINNDTGFVINGNVQEDKKIVIKGNDAVVTDSFLTINSKISEQQLIIENNNITFEGKAQFIVDNNNPPLDVYVNMQKDENPRNITQNENEVTLFVDQDNKLNYINKKGEKNLLKQGVVE